MVENVAVDFVDKKQELWIQDVMYRYVCSSLERFRKEFYREAAECGRGREERRNVDKLQVLLTTYEHLLRVREGLEQAMSAG